MILAYEVTFLTAAGHTSVTGKTRNYLECLLAASNVMTGTIMLGDVLWVNTIEGTPCTTCSTVVEVVGARIGVPSAGGTLIAVPAGFDC